MTQPQNQSPITVLSEDECWNRLAEATVGRLATRIGERIDLVPLNFVTDARTVIFRTAPGNKLAELVLNDEVLLEADSFDEVQGWSVVVRGTAEALSDEAEVAEAARLPLRPMVPTPKRVFVRITPSEVTGRSFRFGDDPLGKHGKHWSSSVS